MWLDFDPPLDAGELPWDILHMDDPAQWYGIPTVAEPPLYLGGKAGRGEEEPCIGERLLSTGAFGLLELNANQAFVGWTVPMMSKLFDWMPELDTASRPRLEMELAKALVLHVLGEVGDETLRDILAKRNEKKATALYSNITAENASLVEEAVALSDRAALTAAVDKASRTKKLPANKAAREMSAAASAPATAPATPTTLDPPPAAAVSPSDAVLPLAAGADGVVAKPRPAFGHDADPAEARAYLPRSLGCSMSTHNKPVGR